MRFSLALVAVLALCALSFAPTRPTAAASCSYTLGFKALHDLIPDVVGDCATDATPQPNGDVFQQTVKGLLVWRKADNWTAFTNGSTTWINGPCGVQSRANEDRFPWEQGGGYCVSGDGHIVGPLPTATTPHPGTRENPLPSGSVVTLGDGWQMRVLGTAADGTKEVLAANQFNDPPPAGYQFFVARISATFNGPGSAHFDGGYRLRTVGAAGVAYSTFDPGCGVVPDALKDSEVFTGGSIVGNLCWSIRASDAASLLLYDTALSDADRVYIALH